MNKQKKIVRPMVALAGGLALLSTGCSLIGRGYDASVDAYDRKFGSTAWAYEADIGNGEIRTVEKRTHRNGKLLAKFRDSADCWTVSFDERLDEGVVIRCQVILPEEWNGRLWLLANDSVGGELSDLAVSFAKDGSAVVCGDGGTGQVRRRNGRLNQIAAGARSEALRKAFFRESLAATLKGGRALVTSRYGRQPDGVFCYGRESGGAQALHLVTADPEAVNGIFLVNPAVDFAACAAYDLNVARQAAVSTSYGRLLRPSQFAAICRATDELKLSAFDAAKATNVWETAGKYDDSFLYDPVAVKKICAAWQTLLTGGAIRSGDKSVAVPPVRLDTDFENRLEARSWRMGWLFGENETGAEVKDADFIARLGEMSAYSPSLDLKPFFDAGGKAVLVRETANARVPVQTVDPLAKVISDVRTVPLLEKEAEEAVKSLTTPQ